MGVARGRVDGRPLTMVSGLEDLGFRLCVLYLYDGGNLRALDGAAC